MDKNKQNREVKIVNGKPIRGPGGANPAAIFAKEKGIDYKIKADQTDVFISPQSQPPFGKRIEIDPWAYHKKYGNFPEFSRQPKSTVQPTMDIWGGTPQKKQQRRIVSRPTKSRTSRRTPPPLWRI